MTENISNNGNNNRVSLAAIVKKMLLMTATTNTSKQENLARKICVYESVCVCKCVFVCCCSLDERVVYGCIRTVKSEWAEPPRLGLAGPSADH